MKKNPIAIVIENDPAALASALALLQQAALTPQIFDSAEQFFGQAALPDCACLILGIALHSPTGRRAQECWLGAPARPPLIFVGTDMDDRSVGSALDMGSLAVFDTPLATQALLHVVQTALNM